MKSRRSEITAQKKAGKAIAKARTESSSHCYQGFASPPLLLNHLLFEGEFCFITGKKKRSLFGKRAALISEGMKEKVG